jgi:hypothetical protein
LHEPGSILLVCCLVGPAAKLDHVHVHGWHVVDEDVSV